MFRVAIGKTNEQGEELGFEYTAGGVVIRTMWTYRRDSDVYREDWNAMIDALNAGIDVFQRLDSDGQRHVSFSHRAGVVVIGTPNAEINVSAAPLKVQLIKCCEELAKKHRVRPPAPAPAPVAEPEPIVEAPKVEPEPVVMPAPVIEPEPVVVPAPVVIDDEVPIVIEQLPPRQPTPAPVEEPAPAVEPVEEPTAEPAPIAEPIADPQPDAPAAQIPLQPPAAEHEAMDHAEDNIDAEKDVMQFINQFLAADAPKN